VSRFVVNPNLEAEVAARILRPLVDQATDRVRDGARAGAPPVKVWLTARDERVRPSHVRTDGQAIPANLRYKVPRPDVGNDVGDERTGHELAREPRDPSLSIGNRANCRCASVLVPGMLGETIHAEPAVVIGPKVTGTVYTRFPRAAESELGTTDDEAAHFMRNAAIAEAQRHRA
jgi:hypothetical protein